MPTASTIDGYPAYNLGPLTTTWTAPASCITNGFNTALAYTIREDEGPYAFEVAECRASIWDDMDECFPDGGEFMSIVTSIENRAEPTYGAHFYHSPGLQCPEGWFTAGAATVNGDGDVEKTGSIFGSLSTRSIEDIWYKPFNQHFADALDAGETAIWCCPSGYTVSALNEICWSTLSAEDVTITNLCEERILNTAIEYTNTFTIDGTTLTRDELFTWEGERTISTRIHETTMALEEFEEGEVTPVVYYPLITMVHKEGDSDRVSGDDDDGNEGGEGEGEGEGEGNGDNAASGLMSAGVMAFVVGAAGVLGAALVL